MSVSVVGMVGRQGGDEGGGRAHQQVFLGRPTGYAGTVGGKSCVIKAFIL